MRLKGYSAVDDASGGGGAPATWELSYQEINLGDRDDRDYLDATVAMGQAPSAQSWRWYEEIGEVRYAINRAARVAGYMTPYAEYVNGKGEVTRNHQDSPTVNRIVNDITSRFGGTRGLVQRYYALMKIPGEMVLIRFKDRGSSSYDGYWFLSPDEIERQGMDSVTVRSLSTPLIWKTARGARVASGSKDPFKREVAIDDVIGRVWNPSFRYVDECDSPMMAVNPLCEMLNDLTNSIKARIRSRFAMNGMLLVPSGMSDAAIGVPTPETLLYSNNKVLNAIIHIMTVNMVKYGGAAVDRLPIALMGPADELDKVKHLIFDAKVDEVDLKLRVELIGRVLEGLDQQKAATRDGAEQSHWGAWATDEAERRITVEPDLQQFDHLATRLILHKRLKEDEEWEDSRILGWRIRHKLNEAMTRVNQAEDFRQAFDRGELHGTALRRATGAEETDAPNDNQRLKQLGHKIGNPILAFYGVDALTVHYDKASQWGKTKPGPESTSDGDATPEGPGVSDPGSPNDRDSDAPKTEEPG